MSWTETQLAEARGHWAAVRLASGGGVSQVTDKAWALIPARVRAVLIAARSGMPIGLIVEASGECSATVMTWLKIYMALAKIEPLKAMAEAVTERVPMWRERPSRRAVRIVEAAQVTA